MTIRRYDVPTMGQAARNLLQIRAEYDIQYWKARHDEVLETLHGLIESLNGEHHVRIVCGQIDITVEVTKI